MVLAMGAVQDSIRSRALARSDADGSLGANGSVVLLEPEKWAGRPLPILGHIDVADRISAGSWTVVLYHHDCSTCLDLLPQLESKARSGRKIALIEMPPYAPEGQSPVSRSSVCLRGRLSDQRDWFATTPVVMSLAEGRVTAVADGEQAKADLPR
jgi:hypothetical protein